MLLEDCLVFIVLRTIFILVYGESDTEEEAIVDHERKLRALMDRCRERGLVLNKDKLRFRRMEMRFIGHLINSEGLKPDPEKVKAKSRRCRWCERISWIC